MNGRVGGLSLAPFQGESHAQSLGQQPQRAGVGRRVLRVLVTLVVALLVAACVAVAAIPILADHLREPLAGYFSDKGLAASPSRRNGILATTPAPLKRKGDSIAACACASDSTASSASTARIASR